MQWESVAGYGEWRGIYREAVVVRIDAPVTIIRELGTTKKASIRKTLPF